MADTVLEFVLSKPINAHGNVVDRLELREPTAKDIRECGFLFDTGKDSKVSLNPEAIADYIVSLAGIPKSSVDQMAAKDFQLIGLQLASFFA